MGNTFPVDSDFHLMHDKWWATDLHHSTSQILTSALVKPALHKYVQMCEVQVKRFWKLFHFLLFM